MTPRIGSLFSGAGGLDLAVEQVFGGETVWHSEVDPAASKVLAHRWPGTPNHGDITRIDWATVEPVDILCGGYPCQPFSAAGRRNGVNDERHLWPYFHRAIRRLRPRYVVLENVAGHRSMGFDSVLGDLAGVGFDADWCSVRASDVGAPHRRERLFVVAYPNSSTGRQRIGSGQTSNPGQLRGFDAALSGAGPVDLLPTPAACNPNDGETPETWLASRERVKLTANNGNGMGTPLSIAVQLLPTPNAQDGNGGKQRSREALARGDRQTNLTDLPRLLPTPKSRDHKGPNQRQDDTCLRGALLPTPRAWGDADNNPSGHQRHSPGVEAVTYHFPNQQWGKYGPAIHRWEQLTRPVPSPTEPNTKGNPRLNPAFSEWMMGWPDGWVTQVPGISRNDQLRIIGNGVVDRAATTALRYLLAVCSSENPGACSEQARDADRTSKEFDMTDNTACKSCNGSGTSYTGKSACAFCDGSGLRLKPRFRAVCECGERQPRWTTAYTSNQWMYKHIVAAHRYEGPTVTCDFSEASDG